MAFKESQKIKEKVKEISESESHYESRERNADPEKNHYMAIYENMARSKTAAYEEYLEDKEGFLEKEYARRNSVNKLEEELTNFEGDRSRTEAISKALKESIQDRRKYLKKKVSILAKMKMKIDTNNEDIGKLRGKNRKLKEKIEKLTDDDRKHQKLKEKYENYIRENNFDIRDKEEEVAKLRKQNIEEKFKRTWEDIWALDERELTLPDYNVLERELKTQLKEDAKEVERREAIRKEFEALEKAGATPESIMASAEQQKKTLSRLYDEQEGIREAVEGKAKFKLLGKTVAGAAQVGLGMINVALRRKNRYQRSEDLALGLFKLRAGAKGLLINRATIDQGILKIPPLKEVQEGTEFYREPKEDDEKQVGYQFRHQILTQSSILVNEAGPDINKSPIPPPTPDLTPPGDDEDLPVIEADESLPVVEAESEPVRVEEKDNEIDIADKVSKKIFEGMVREYTKYLESESEDDKGVNAFFKAMKNAGIKPGFIKKEGRYVKRWMKSIQKWAKDTEKLDREEVKRTMSDNFFSAIVKIHTAEDLKKTGVVRDITGDMFKQYLLIRRLKILEQ